MGQADYARVQTWRPTVLSLYAGAGGLDLGFRDAGFQLVWANEKDRHACESYRANLGEHIVEGDLLVAELPRQHVDVVIGGPPCQGWSRIGRMDPNDERSQHVDRFMDVVAQLRPEAFVMENVAHLAEAKRWEHVRERLLLRAREELGYAAEIFVLNAADYGVAQSRRRMFFIGSRTSPPRKPRRVSVKKQRTVRQTLAALPALGEMGNETRCSARVIPAKVPVMRRSPFQGSLLFNGSGRPLYLDSPARTLPAAMGGNATPIIDQLELRVGGHSWVLDYHRHLLLGGDPVSECPGQLRRLTVEEAAALQSFPTSYRFLGPINARYRQIGNAVPPRLARAVARAVLLTLRQIAETA